MYRFSINFLKINCFDTQYTYFGEIFGQNKTLFVKGMTGLVIDINLGIHSDFWCRILFDWKQPFIVLWNGFLWLSIQLSNGYNILWIIRRYCSQLSHKKLNIRLMSEFNARVYGFRCIWSWISIQIQWCERTGLLLEQKSLRIFLLSEGIFCFITWFLSIPS